MASPRSTFALVRTQFPVLAAHRARALRSSSPPKCRGRREGRAPAGTRGPLCANCAGSDAQRHTGEAKHPAFPAQWVYGLCRALLGERCTIAPVASRMNDGANPVGPQRHRKPWRTGPGRQDHTILPYAGCTRRVRAAFAHGVTRPANACTRCRPRPPHSHPAFVTIAIRPSARAGVTNTCDNSEFE